MPFKLGMQVRIRTNSLEFEFAPNSHEFVDTSEFKFATSNSEFEFPLDSLEFTRGGESIGTYNSPSILCIWVCQYPLP